VYSSIYFSNIVAKIQISEQNTKGKLVFICISLNLINFLTLRNENLFSFPLLNRNFALSLHLYLKLKTIKIMKKQLLLLILTLLPMMLSAHDIEVQSMA